VIYSLGFDRSSPRLLYFVERDAGLKATVFWVEMRAERGLSLAAIGNMQYRKFNAFFQPISRV
jgi:hypothetical protein